MSASAEEGVLSSSQGLFHTENLKNFFRGDIVDLIRLNYRLVKTAREKRDRGSQNLTRMVPSIATHRFHLVDDLFSGVDLDNLSSTLALVVEAVFSSKDNVDVDINFH